jgi:hypothetical protein
MHILDSERATYHMYSVLLAFALLQQCMADISGEDVEVHEPARDGSVVHVRMSSASHHHRQVPASACN